MAEVKDINYRTSSDKKNDAKKVANGNLKDRSFKQKIKDAFISEEVHDVKSYIIFDVIIPAVKETFRNLIVNTLDMSLFGKIRSSKGTEQRGGSTYISYDRAYGGTRDDGVRRQTRSTASLRINELNRVVFQNKEDAIDVLSHLLEEIEEYHVASVADFLSYSGIDVSPIHHKWGWYDLIDAAVVEDPDAKGFYVKLPRPVEI